MATTTFWTVAEGAHLPDDAFRYAVIRGVLYRMPPPMARHGRIVSVIDWHLYGCIAVHGLGAFDNQSGFILERDPNTLLSPDLACVPTSRVPASATLDGEDVLLGFRLAVTQLFA